MNYNDNGMFGKGNGAAYSDTGYNPKDLHKMSIWELLNIPVEIAVPELLCRGIKIANKLGQTAYETYQAVSDDEYAMMCRQILTMDWCLSWFKDNKAAYPLTAYYFIAVEKNPKPRNENDKYSVTLALIDRNKQPIYVSGGLKGYGYTNEPITPNIVAVSIPTRDIDGKIIGALNGENTVLIKL